MYSIDEAAERLKVTPTWVRRAIREKRLASTLVPIEEGSLTRKHVISESALVAFENREGRKKARREDKRAKWVFYASPDEVNRIKELLYTSDDTGLQVVASTIIPNAPKQRWLDAQR